MPEPDLNEIFGAQGVLHRQFDAYVTRPAQQAMAAAIQDAMSQGASLIAEAGTGTGKTWAYLVPALLAGSKVLVSTGTRTLQDQLFHRDLPRLREALHISVKVALLKGRSNYVCPYHLERLSNGAAGPLTPAEQAQLRDIQIFARQSASGDRAELDTLPEDAPIWRRVSSTRENCLTQECPYIRDCPLYRARRQAQEADVVVINHALFMADLALREQGITDLLPQADMVVFDEAHQLPEVATHFLGVGLSSYQLLDLARDMVAAGRAHARGLAPWDELASRVETAARELRLSCAAVEKLSGRRVIAQAMPQAEGFASALDSVSGALASAHEALAGLAQLHPDMDGVAALAQDLAGRLAHWRDAPDKSGDEASVSWVEVLSGGVRLHSAPLSVASIFGRYHCPGQTRVFTSATLSVNGDFTAFQRALGLEDARTQSWPSPFDYAQQGLLYVPAGLPLPGDRAFSAAFCAALLPLVQANAGGTLVLCTTLRAVDVLAGMLEAGLAKAGDSRPVLRQGQQSRALLLAQFRAQAGAVLVGSASFWEGVDVPGEALSLLAIDKLPFAPPDEPVLQARMEQCRKQGGNPFMEYQLPEAAIALKQGAGRLIRSETDRGLLMVGDGRLVEKPYGRALWRGLPPFARTRAASDALAFVQALAGQPAPIRTS